MEKDDLALLPGTYSENRKPTEATLEKFLTFHDKQSYIEWRAYWKEEYAALSERIRELRTAWRAEGSNHDAQRNSQLYNSRARARSMLALRALSKQRAEALYQESKAAAEVA